MRGFNGWYERLLQRTVAVCKLPVFAEAEGAVALKRRARNHGVMESGIYGIRDLRNQGSTDFLGDCGLWRLL